MTALEHRHRLKGRFFVFGESGSGKSTLLRKVEGTYEPSSDREVHKCSSDPNLSVQLNDVQKDLCLPSYLLKNADVSGSTLVSMHIHEISSTKTTKFFEDLANGLAMACQSKSTSQNRAASNSTRGNCYESTNGFPEEHDVCGLVWVVRSNCLALNKTLVVNWLKKEVSAAVRDNLVHLSSKGDLSDPQSWSVDSKIVDEWKKRLGLLYKQEAAMYMQQVHNDALAICKLPSFMTLPVMFVLNVAPGITSREIECLKNTLLFHVQYQMAQLIDSNNDIPTLCSERALEPNQRSLCACFGEILSLAFNMKCDGKAFSRVFNMEAFKEKMNQSSLFAYPQVIAHLEPENDISLVPKPSDNSTRKSKNDILTKAPQGALLRVTLCGQPHNMNNSLSLCDGGMLDKYEGDTETYTKEIEEGETDLEMTMDGHVLPETYYNFLSQSPSVTDRGEMVFPSPPLVYPPPLVVAVTRLGNETTKEEVSNTCNKRDLYNYYRKKGTLGFFSAGGRNKLHCDQFPCYIYNWMLDAIFWQAEYELSKRVVFLKSNTEQ